MSAPPPALLRPGSYFNAADLHRPVWDRLRTCVPEDALLEMQSVVFVLIKPDAVASGKTEAVLAFLREGGFAVLAAHLCATTTPAQFESLYRYNLTLYNQQNQVGCWWLNSRVYLRAPVVTLLLYLPGAPRGPEAYERIRALKGPSNPYASRGTLRAELRACNKALNLVHASDDPLSSAREFLIFHGADVFARHLTELRTLREHGTRAVERHAAHALELVLAGCAGERTELDFVATMVGVKARVLSVLAATCEGTVHAPVARLYAEYRRLAGCDAPLQEKLTSFRRLLRAERALLARAAPSTDPEALRLLRELADFRGYNHGLAERVLRWFDGRGLRLEAWSRLVLETCLYYLPEIDPSVEAAAEPW